MKGSNKQQGTTGALSRRSFLMGAAATGALAAASLTGCAPKSAADAEEMPMGAGAADVQWDEEYDFVVCGSGTALWGAFAAADAGATACVLEKQAMLGGTSATSTGAFFLPYNPVCEEEGIPDNEEDAITYIKNIAEGQGEEAVMTAYPKHSRSFVEWSADVLGVPWQAWGTGSMEMWKGFIVYYDVPGARLGRTLGYLYEENADADLSSGGGYLGPVMWNYLTSKLDEFGIKSYTKCPATKLIMNGDGSVAGVRAEKNGKPFYVKANKGVLLGCGDFSFNKQWRDSFLRNPIYHTCSVDGNVGDGIRMGLEAGAALGNMSSVYGCSMWGYVGDGVPEDIVKDFTMWDADVLRAKPNSLIVNRFGKRFGDESSNYHVFNRAFEGWDSGNFDHANIPGYWICDATYTEHYPLPHAEGVGDVPEGVVVADTIEELAEKCGIDPMGLAQTLATFNENARQGLDPEWHRGERLFDVSATSDPERTDLVNTCLGPVEKAPFYCMTYLPGTLGTSGGLRISENAQVIGMNGEPITGLYASGCNAASVFGAGYPGSGGPIGGGSVMSYVAARHAATR